MKFDWNGRLSFKDPDGDRLYVDACHRGFSRFLYININGRVVSMTREEARKFAKAIRKEVRKVHL